MAWLTVLVAIPLGFAVVVFCIPAVLYVYDATLGSMFVRWRYQERFERQYAELLSCLDQGLPAATGEEAVAAAEDCFAAAELHGDESFALYVLVPSSGDELRWQAVRYVDSSFGLTHLFEEDWSEGLHIIDIPWVGRGLMHVQALPGQDPTLGRARAYSVVVPLSELR